MKWYKKLLLILTIIASILGLSNKVFAEETHADWISLTTHSYTTEDNPFVSFGRFAEGQSNERIPWYFYGLDDASKGITIKYVHNNSNTYYYLSRVNTASIWLKNLVADSQSSQTMSVLGDRNYIIDSDFRRNFLDAGIDVGNPYYITLNPFYETVLDNVDFTVTSSQDLLDQLTALNFTYPGDLNAGDLPLLSFSIDRKTVPQASLNLTTTKLNLKWDYTEKDPYKSNPSIYTFDIMASANFQTASIGQIWDANNLSVNDANKVYLSNGGQNISINNFSFLYDDVGKAVYSRSNVSWTNDSINAPTLGYILYVRTRNNTSTQFSYWKVFKVQAGGYVNSTNVVMKPDGTFASASDYADGDDGIDPSNQGIAPYDPDSSTTAQGDPTGGLYNGESTFNITTMIASLKSIVNSIKELPSIFATLVTFMPEWLISLLILSIGMLIVIGVVKVIVR